MIFSWGIERRRNVTPGDKSYLIRKSRGKCEYCGGDIIGKGITPNIHHIVPFASGGSGGYHNLIVLCPNCHSKVDHISKEELRLKIQYRLPKSKQTQNLTMAKSSTKKASAKKAAPKKTTAKKTTPKKTSLKKKPTRKTNTKKSSAKRTTAKKTVPKKTAPKNTTTKKDTAKKATPKKTSTRRATSKKK